MVWTAPITFVPNSVLTASQLNTYLRDNMLETMPARSVHAGSHFAVVARGMIAERSTISAYVDNGTASETTTSTDYTDLATIGPSVTVATSVSALIFLYCQQWSSTGGPTWMSYEVSGDTQSDASDNRAIQLQQGSANAGQAWGAAILHGDLTPGMNTFTAKYRVSGSLTGDWRYRRLAVFPL